MTLQRKRILIGGAVVLAVLAAVALASNLIVLRSFAELEEEDTLRHVTRVVGVLQDDVAQLDRQLADWAAWDETYAYVVTRSPEYVRSNIPDATYGDLRLNVFLIFTRTGELVYGRGFDLAQGRPAAIPVGLHAHLTPGAPLLQHAGETSSASGLVVLPEGPMLIASRPILTSTRTGPTRGMMIWGRTLSEEEVGRLGKITHLDVAAVPVDDVAVLAELPVDLSALRRGHPVTRVDVVDARTIAGLAVLPDIYRQPALLLRVVTPRAIFAQGRRTVTYFLLWFALTAAVAAALSLSLIGRLATSRHERAQSDLRYRTLVYEASPVTIFTLDPAGRVQMWNPAAERLYGWRPDEILRRPLPVVPEDRAGELAALQQRVLGGETVNGIETEHLRRDGSRLQVSVSSAPLRAADGEILGVMAVVVDITQRRAAEDAVRRQMERLASLRTIDVAITGSLDLRVTLNVLLDQVVGQLGVHAVDLLLFSPQAKELRYVAGRGFRTSALQHTHLRLGEGYAGRAALERQMVVVTDLAAERGSLTDAPLLDQEGFRSYIAVPLMAKGELKGVLEVFHRVRLEPDADWMSFLESLAGQAAIAIDSATLFDHLQRANLELTAAYDTTLEGWTNALDLRDEETEGHTQRVTDLTLRLARRLGVPESELVHIRRGALLHDIGKMGVPDAILRKPGPLTDEEWAIMRAHPVYAYELLTPIPYLRQALDIPYGHHEKWDGSGYPRGLTGTQIPLAARIFAVVDVWDALTSNRPYRPAWPRQMVLTHVREQAGKHFDPSVVDGFLHLLGEDGADGRGAKAVD